MVALHPMMVVMTGSGLCLAAGLQIGHLPRLRCLAELVGQIGQELGLGPVAFCASVDSVLAMLDMTALNWVGFCLLQLLKLTLMGRL